MKLRYNLGQAVQTPNGPGTYDGILYDQGRQYEIVRHTITRMTSRDRGKCLTPKATISTQYLYEISEVKPL